MPLNKKKQITNQAEEYLSGKYITWPISCLNQDRILFLILYLFVLIDF